ncbi:fibroblast growth factor binding protein 2a [Neoarius graeffei]|uniref:fibroblast growth factor binding protein 2a n=1 Tax=Neoarius graeffei TaxID=443677 RepID=UPI00298CAF9C|nr:fibroblast growth factor binding protein 2a [Neoarius graeffei]
MQILSFALILSCCVWAAVAHNQDRKDAAEAGRSKSVWEEPIQFNTKNKDRCSMRVTGHGELTRLRISCVGQEASYWCEYEGKPDICRNYNTNPRHFFTQIMWELRKLKNACQGSRNLKPTMCKKASDESQMVFTTEKLNNERQKPTKQKPAKPQPTRPPPSRPAKAKTEQPGTKAKTIKKVLTPKAATQPLNTTTPSPARSAENLAQQYCWHSMQDFCTEVISWFTK